MSKTAAEVIGPCYTPEQLEAAGLPLESQQQMVDEHCLLRLRTTDDVDLYPVWQFEEDTFTPVRFLPQILTELAEGNDEPWDWAFWLIGLDNIPYWDEKPLDVVILEAREQATLRNRL